MNRNQAKEIASHTMLTGSNNRRCCALVAASLLQLPCASLATVVFDASATGRYEYDTNVFDLQRGFPVPGTSDLQHSDTLYTYGALLDTSYLWSQQKLFASLSTTDFRYDRFAALDHTEYNLDGGFNWKVGREIDGTLEILRDHSMVPFSAVQNSETVFQTDQRESVKVGFEVSPKWRIETSGRHATSEQDYFNAPDIRFTESSGQATLKYLGLAGVTFGLSGTYADGNYAGAGTLPNSSYRQSGAGLVATYDASGHSTFDGNLSYSDRTSASALNTISGVTGGIDYVNTLTGKTSLQVQLSRAINSYIANSSSEIDNVAALNLRWQATYKIGVMGGYSWTKRELPGQGNNPVGGERVDHVQYASIKVDYEPFRWLSIKPYVNLQTRSSNFVGGNFDSSTYGLYFTVQWQNQAR